jgi:alcohol dehydrogenase
VQSRAVWRIKRPGSLDRLERQAESLPDPGPGEVRVAVKAVGLNFADVFACLGLYSATPPGAFIPGLEVAGIVEALGPARAGSDSAGTIRPGEPVYGLTRFGGYATAVNLDLRYLRPVPQAWSFAEAAAFPVQALTAWYGLIELGSVQAGEAVLVQSAAGGVGLNALAILAGIGARVIATVGRPAKRDFLVGQRGVPADHIIVRDRRHFGAQLDRALATLGSEDFDLVFDAVAGPFFRPAYRRLRPEGRYVVYGASDFMPTRSRLGYLPLAWRYVRRPRLDPLRMIQENRSVMAFNLIWLWERADRLPRAFGEIERLIQAPPLVGRRFPFAEAPAALRHLQSGESIGKVVLEV